jgi:cellulose synthase/poly-beta-1,6-N-acetylglucosamine synthase-like glycosyltransferase
MAALISFLLLILVGIIAVPVVVLFSEVVLGLVCARRVTEPPSTPRKKLAILVPAYNESTALVATLTDIRSQLRPTDRLLVIADNCTDDTARAAMAAGAEVIERHDRERLGKGYALDFGLQHLSAKPPDIVIIVDADCRLAANAIDSLAATCTGTGRPAQAAYLMTAPSKSQINFCVAEFAWRVKNLLRPLGLDALGQACPLFGTGMAFPWDVIRKVDLADGSLVEDLKLGVELSLAGHPPQFCPAAVVTSTFASSAVGAKSQRERWERGHIGMIRSTVPTLLKAFFSRWNWRILILALDLAVPPLSLLLLLVGGTFVVTLVWATVTSALLPLGVSTVLLLLFALSIYLSWLQYGYDVLPGRAIVSIGPYVFRKLGLYKQILSGQGNDTWVRTDRAEGDALSEASERAPPD